jgi:hypothetical protein
MKRYIILNRTLFVLTVLLFVNNSFAQCYVEDTYFSGINNEGETLNDYDLTIRLSDTLNLEKLEISIGPNPGDTSVFQCIYHLYSTPSGCQNYFTKNGIEITLDLDSIEIPGISFYKVVLFDFQNNQMDSFIKQF